MSAWLVQSCHFLGHLKIIYNHTFSRCDKGWEGDSCSDPTYALPTHLMDDFTQGPQKGLWQYTTGAEVTTYCGVLAAGPSLHFKQVSAF